ncbi:MAG: hypothetical protein RBR35_06425 [Salinivirgaceae bacterium]|nr:hypothetical protein [Salinivirgaceae bacterium]
METNIKYLLEKYYEGTTTLEEERAIRSYFAKHETTDELREEQRLFNSFVVDEKEIPLSLESDIFDAIAKQTETPEKRKHIAIQRIVSWATAAIIVLSVGFGWYYTQIEKRTQLSDTFQNPEEAYQETMRVLAYVGSKMNKAQEELQPIAKMSKVTETLQPIITINNNLHRVDQLKILTNPLSTNKQNE